MTQPAQTHDVFEAGLAGVDSKVDTFIGQVSVFLRDRVLKPICAWGHHRASRQLMMQLNLEGPRANIYSRAHLEDAEGLKAQLTKSQG